MSSLGLLFNTRDTTDKRRVIAVLELNCRSSSALAGKYVMTIIMLIAITRVVVNA